MSDLSKVLATVSNRPVATCFTAGDVTMIVQDGVSKQIEASVLMDCIAAYLHSSLRPASGLSLLNRLASLSPNQLNLLSQFLAMTTPLLTLVGRDTNNNETRADLPLPQGRYNLAVDASGTVSLVAVDQNLHAGTIPFTATDAYKDVVFAAPFPDVNYEIVVCMNGLAGAWKPTNKTATGFRATVVGAAIVGNAGYIAREDG